MFDYMAQAESRATRGDGDGEPVVTTMASPSKWSAWLVGSTEPDDTEVCAGLIKNGKL